MANRCRAGSMGGTRVEARVPAPVLPLKRIRDLFREVEAERAARCFSLLIFSADVDGGGCAILPLIFELGYWFLVIGCWLLAIVYNSQLRRC